MWVTVALKPFPGLIRLKRFVSRFSRELCNYFFLSIFSTPYMCPKILFYYRRQKFLRTKDGHNSAHAIWAHRKRLQTTVKNSVFIPHGQTIAQTSSAVSLLGQGPAQRRDGRLKVWCDLVAVRFKRRIRYARLHRRVAAPDCRGSDSQLRCVGARRDWPVKRVASIVITACRRRSSDILTLQSRSREREGHVVIGHVDRWPAVAAVKKNLGLRSLPIQIQNIFSSTHHIKYLNICMEY
jgi:hypothetical protein